MSNNPIPRKAVDLDSETIKALSIQAVYAGKSLKAYMENILMDKAKPASYIVARTSRNQNNDRLTDTYHVIVAEENDNFEKAKEAYYVFAEDENTTICVLAQIIKSTTIKP